MLRKGYSLGSGRGVRRGRRRSRPSARATTGSDSDLLVPVAATPMMIIPVVVIIVVAALLVMIVTAIANRPQEVIEGLRRDASPLPPRRRVREAEMNPHVDASVDHVVGQIREAMVRSLIRNGLRGSRRDLERHFVGVEKAR